MTHEEKAKELVERFYEKQLSPNSCEYCFGCENICKSKLDNAKQCALICVEREIELLKSINKRLEIEIDTDVTMNYRIRKAEQVKQEIEKL